MSLPVLILDFGSQTTQLIARRLRAERIYCEIHPCTLGLDQVQAMQPQAIILSGGPSSVYEEGAPSVSPEIFSLGVPLLGICYGMQLMSHLLGGHVQSAGKREFGRADVRVVLSAGPTKPFVVGHDETVWMSHGDHVTAIPEGFEVLAATDSCPFAAVGNASQKLYGVQFHPEVAHTARGAEMLRAFAVDVAGVVPNWTPDGFVQNALNKIHANAGDDHVLCGLSGGVDSSVAAMLVHKAIGDRLTCVFVDNGLLRKGEAEEVLRTFRDHMGLKLVHVDASKDFLDALHGQSDPETKRKIIGRVFIEVFTREAAKLTPRPAVLVQGTLYPDVIESVSFNGPSVVIKSHHNVGGLPEKLGFRLLEPLRELFKDEVREVGLSLGLSHELLYRHPFPGPGLGIRVLGDMTAERLTTLRDADAIFLDELRKADYYNKVWQAFAVLLPVKTVGVMGDARTYEEVLALRAVTATDGMTADFAHLPMELLGRVASRIANEVRGVNRVVYDVSSKPPATIEWE